MNLSNHIRMESNFHLQVKYYSLDPITRSDIQRLPGEIKKGEVYEEFYLDDEALQKMLIETFYILKK